MTTKTTTSKTKAGLDSKTGKPGLRQHGRAHPSPHPDPKHAAQLKARKSKPLP